jgi:3-hydroxyacyl-[acyl-carrier-protein] dehydratase
MNSQEIIAQLPYVRPFLFVDNISMVNSTAIEGGYSFRPDEFFYAGHFKNHPVTPGVILIECMAQIALVAHGIYLLNAQNKPFPAAVAFSSADVDFLKPVYPGETVNVRGKLKYFRLGKIKSEVELIVNEEVACKGELSGMVKA